MKASFYTYWECGVFSSDVYGTMIQSSPTHETVLMYTMEASVRENLTLLFANSEGPGLGRLVSIFVSRYLRTMVSLLSICKISVF